jgi:hypothetical protein
LPWRPPAAAFRSASRRIPPSDRTGRSGVGRGCSELEYENESWAFSRRREGRYAPTSACSFDVDVRSASLVSRLRTIPGRLRRPALELSRSIGTSWAAWPPSPPWPWPRPPRPKSQSPPLLPPPLPRRPPRRSPCVAMTSQLRPSDLGRRRSPRLRPPLTLRLRLPLRPRLRLRPLPPRGSRRPSATACRRRTPSSPR